MRWITKIILFMYMRAPWACRHLAYQTEPWIQGPIRRSPRELLTTLTKLNRHHFGGDCQVMMAEGEKSHENVVDEELVLKRNSTSAIWTCYKHRYCGKHAEQLVQLLKETQPTSITSCNTTIKTNTNNSKRTLAIKKCIVHNMQTSIFVYLSQVI